MDRKLILAFMEEESGKEEIQIVPMIDVMLFLLVFFMVYTLNVVPMMLQDLKIPSSSTVERKDIEKPIRVFLKKDGTIVLDDRRQGEGALRSFLRDLENKEQVSAIIVADRDSSVQSVMKVIDILKEEGVYRIGISGEKE